MKTFELAPTYENLLDTYEKDAIGRNKDVIAFAEILNTVDEGLAVAVDGSWGSGKTFFVKQVKMLLDAYNEHTQHIDEDDRCCLTSEKREFQPHLCVYYDAWENDNDNDPILSLVYAIIKSVNADFSLSGSGDCLKNAAKVLEFFTGKDWIKLIDVLKGENPLDNIDKEKSIELAVKEFLDSLMAERGNRLNIFIDELDRCKPSFAVKLLERIKHYFSNDRVTFIFSINTKELQHTIRKHYGDDFDASRYLERFFDLRISLPEVNKNLFYNLIGFNTTYLYDDVCDAVIRTYDFSMREIAKYLYLTKIAASKPTHDNRDFDFSFSKGKAMLMSLTYVIPVMIGLKLYDINLYENFINGRNPEPLIEAVGRFDDHYFSFLLNDKESFDIEDESRTTVTVGDKLRDVYYALFGTTYTTNRHSSKIGQCEFSAQTKESVMRTDSLLSQYSDFNVE